MREVLGDVQKIEYDNAQWLDQAGGRLAIYYRVEGAFNLDEESSELRDAYGRSRFGQGCLLARRLVERGVPFVEVVLDASGAGSWDSHVNNFDMVHTHGREVLHSQIRTRVGIVTRTGDQQRRVLWTQESWPQLGDTSWSNRNETRKL